MLALFAGGIGWQEILLIMLVLLVFFGRRIPEVMRSLGRGVSQFKKGLSDVEDEVRGMAEEPADSGGEKGGDRSAAKNADESAAKNANESAGPAKQLAEPPSSAEARGEVQAEVEAETNGDAATGGDAGELAG